MAEDKIESNSSMSHQLSAADRAWIELKRYRNRIASDGCFDDFDEDNSEGYVD